MSRPVNHSPTSRFSSRSTRPPAALVSDAVNLGLYNSFTAYISCGAITGDSVLTVYATPRRRSRPR
jgi:hypothetical protein